MICDNLTVSNGRLLFAGQDTVGFLSLTIYEIK